MKKNTGNCSVALEFFLPGTGKQIKLPIYEHKVPAGFPSPADDYIDKKLDLNEYLIKNPAATFFVKVSGTSMIDAGIYDGDILIVDRSIENVNNKIVVCTIDGEFTVKRICKKGKELTLIPENSKYNLIVVTEEMDFRIWGVVTYAIHTLK